MVPGGTRVHLNSGLVAPRLADLSSSVGPPPFSSMLVALRHVYLNRYSRVRDVPARPGASWLTNPAPPGYSSAVPLCLARLGHTWQGTRKEVSRGIARGNEE
jgi:hypothetical protein